MRRAAQKTLNHDNEKKIYWYIFGPVRVNILGWTQIVTSQSKL